MRWLRYTLIVVLVTSLTACASLSGSKEKMATSVWTVCQLPTVPVTVHTSSEGLIELSSTSSTVYPSTIAKPIGGLDTLLIAMGAHFPEIAQKAWVEGVVIVEFSVSEHGVVTDIEMVKTLGARIEENVDYVLSGTVFEPGRVDDLPVASRLRLPLEFTLKPVKKEPEIPDLPLQTYMP